MKIRTRLILIFVLVVGLGFYFLVKYVLDNLRVRYQEAVEETLVDQAHVMASLVEIQLEGNIFHFQDLRAAFREAQNRVFLSKIYQLKKTSIDQRVYVTDDRGMVVFDSDGGKDEGQDYSRWRDVYLTLRGQYGARSSRAVSDDPASSVLYVAAPIYHDGKIFGVLTIAKPTRNIELFFQTARTPIFIAGTVAALTVILLVIAFSTWITHPLQLLTRYARSVRDGKRIDVPKLYSPEIAELGAAFEEMRETLEGKKYIEQYVQHLTHELKSPLAAIQASSELLQENTPLEVRQRFLAHIQNEVERLKNIVERMLELASLESRRHLQNVETVALKTCVEEAVMPLEAWFQNKQVQWTVDIPGDGMVLAERFLLVQALRNLFQNSLDFIGRGGKIAVSAVKINSKLQFKIEDDGPGIPEFALARVFEKFYSLPRPGDFKKSTGLGLSFVREVIELHGGAIKIENIEGSGVRVLLEIPLIV